MARELRCQSEKGLFLIVTYFFRNAYYRPHSHAGLTTHIILRGELTIRYPDADLPEKQTFGPGSIVNVEAKQRHEVWVGDQGCTYTIGEDQIVPTPK